MNVLVVSHNFPPETNALAHRTYHHARHWVEDGGHVEVLTDVPSFPEGRVYDGYRNRYEREVVDGIVVHRCPLFVLENRGALRRTLCYTSFMFSALWHSRHLDRNPDVVVASSPHLFTALAGWAISWLRGVPFVLEVRDLWPESVVDTGVLSEDSPAVRLASSAVDRLYDVANHIVVVAPAFRDRLEGHGVDSGNTSVLTNGADLDFFSRKLDPEELDELRGELDLDGSFVASYVGTVGRAHGVKVMLEAAERCSDEDVVFMVVGTGAEREDLERAVERRDLDSFRLVPKQPRERVPYLLALSDVSVVHLRDRPVFRTVVPSKIFEAMATGTPIAIGVRGQARELVEEAEAGVFVEPEDPEALVGAVLRLRDDRELRERLQDGGRRAAVERYSREAIALRYWELLERIGSRGSGRTQFR